MQTQTSAIALNFSFRLRSNLSAAQLAKAVALNAAEANPSVCHSHDFIDANVVMAEAFETVLGRSIDLQSEADDCLWADAWTLAKANEFSL